MTLCKNFLDRLVKFIYKFAKSVTKTSSKIQELKTYNQTISNFVHANKW